MLETRPQASKEAAKEHLRSQIDHVVILRNRLRREGDDPMLREILQRHEREAFKLVVLEGDRERISTVVIERVSVDAIGATPVHAFRQTVTLTNPNGLRDGDIIAADLIPPYYLSRPELLDAYPEEPRSDPLPPPGSTQTIP